MSVSYYDIDKLKKAINDYVIYKKPSGEQLTTRIRNIYCVVNGESGTIIEHLKVKKAAK